jgi:cysteine-rich repeat protein
VIARFERYTGKFAYHCHILEHEDHEMMRQFQTVHCGNVAVEPGEECDDGNALYVDGCTPDCEEEALWQFFGTAQGGTIEFTIEGEFIVVPTSHGQSADAVAVDVAAAINANANLALLEISAASDGNVVGTNGSVTSSEINDPGLSHAPIPLPTWAFLTLAVLMLLPLARMLRRR